MAFFNLTYLGPQDPIKVTCESSGNTSTNTKKAEATAPSTNKLEEDRTVDKGELSRARHNGSYVKHTELMRKHTRNPLGKLSSHSRIMWHVSYDHILLIVILNSTVSHKSCRF